MARLTPRKGQDHVLKALGRMAREGIGCLDDRVVMLDGLDDTDAYSLVSLCDLFVMREGDDHDDLTLRARLRASCRDHVLECFSSEKRKAEYQAAFVAGECRGSVHTEPRHSDGAQGTVS